MAKTLSISEVAARGGVSTSALRFYERQGLISAGRDASGHRTYPQHVLRRLAFITVGQTVGFSLAELRDTLERLPGTEPRPDATGSGSPDAGAATSTPESDC